MAEITAFVPHSAPDGADTDTPGYHGFAWRRQARALKVVRDVYEGTFKLRDEGYLRQFPMEGKDDFSDRVKESVLFNAVKPTVQGWTGMVYRKDPTLSEDVPEAIREDFENIDLSGRDWTTFGRDEFHDKQLDGHGHIFVDWHGPENPASAADEADARPYAVHIQKNQVIRFRTTSVGGNIALRSFAYIETEVAEDGDFAEKEIERVRQYDLIQRTDPDTGESADRVRYRAWTRDKDAGGTWAPEEDEERIVDRELGPRMTRIPLVTDYADRTGYMESDPPALPLAQQNLAHFRLDSDRRDSLHKVLAAIFVTRGVDADQIQNLVTDRGLALPDKDMDARYVEAEGNGLSHAREDLQDTEQRMQALGLQALRQQNRGQRTATEQRMEKAEKDSQLSASAKAHQAALNEVLELFCMWRGIEPAGEVKVNVDFDTLILEPQMIAALEKLVETEKLSLETFWHILAQGEVLPQDFDAATERERLEGGGIGELQAFVAALREQRQADNSTNEGGDDEDESRAA